MLLVVLLCPCFGITGEGDEDDDENDDDEDDDSDDGDCHWY